VSQPGSGVFWLLAVYETNHTRTGRLRLLKLWKRRELSAEPPKRGLQKKKKERKVGHCILGGISQAEKGTGKAAGYEVS
jgi:hypothetical protein